MPPAQGVAREGSGLPPREQRLRSVGLSACLAGALLVLLNERFLIKLSCHTESNALQKSNHPISTQVSLAPKQGAEDKDGSLVQTRGCTNSTPLLSGSQKASRLLAWALPPPWDFLHQHPQPPAPWKPPVGARGNGGHLAAGGRYRGVAEPGTDLLQSWAAGAAPGGIRARAAWAPCPPVPARGREKGADPESPVWGGCPRAPSPELWALPQWQKADIHIQLRARG